MAAAAVAEGSTRDRILQCAVDLVDEVGVAALGVREVARRAGVSHNAPSRHFPTHTALCNAVATVGFTRFCRDLEAAMDGLVLPIDRLCAQAGTYVRFSMANRGMFELMWRGDLLEPKSDELAVVGLHSFELLREAIVECQRTGWNADIEPDTLAGTLWAWVHGIAQLWATGGMPIFAMPTDLESHLRAGFLALGLPREYQL